MSGTNQNITRRVFLSVIGMAFTVAALPGQLFGQGLVSFDKSELTIKTASGTNKFTVEIALSNQQQTQGLMFRRKMAADAGMLFDYRTPRRITMWMKNTYIPLDMIFIGNDGTVVHIVERAVPHSEAVISSRVRARAVLEVNGGTASRLGIKVGDTVSHSIFGN